MTLQVGGDVTEHSQASRSALFNALVEALKRDRKVGTITIQSENCIRIPSKYNQILLNTIRILHQMASSTINYYQQRKQGKGSERWDDWMSAASVSSCSCFASGHTAASGSSHCGETRHKEKGLVQRFWIFEWEWNRHEWINNWMPLQPRGWNFLCCYRCKLYLFWLFWFLNILNPATSEQQHAQCLKPSSHPRQLHFSRCLTPWRWQNSRDWRISSSSRWGFIKKGGFTMGLGRTLQFCESGSTIELGDFPIMVRVRGKKTVNS